MRFLAVLGLLSASLLSHPALAQTTFTGGCPAGTGFTVSPDGLTMLATSAAGGGRASRTVTYIGQWYYTVTPTVVGWSGGYGVAAAAWAASVTNDVGIGDDF